jgi:hypothetical protein
MASGPNGHVEEGCRTTHFSTLRISRQTSAEHFEQCAEFLPFRNRGLGLLAMTVLPIPLTGRAAATEHRMLFEVEAEMRDREADASLGRSVGSTTAWELV